jgi:hypothetical protein
MKERRRLFLGQNLVKRRRFVFTYVFGHIFYFAAENAMTELYFDHVTDFQIVSGFYNAGIYQNVLFAASVVGNRSTFDNA